MPRVSVFMPSYNHAPFVETAVRSVMEQSLQHLELLITDDGSTDGTADVVDSIRDPRIHLRRFDRNRGACAAVNDAIRRSSGQYLCLLNSDDVFLPGKLERQAAFLDEHPEVGAVFAYPDFIDERGQSLDPSTTFYGRIFECPNRTQAEWLRYFFFFGNCLCHPTVMIRRECFERIGLYDERLAQLPDFELWMRVVAAFRIHILPERLIGFRILARQANMSTPRPESQVRAAWEEVHVRKAYVDLPQDLFAAAFAPELQALALDSTGDRAQLLALIGLATNRPSLHRFGLELLHARLPAQAGERDRGLVSHAAYIRETGRRDLFNIVAVNELAARLAAPPAALRIQGPSGTPPSWTHVPATDPKLHLGCGRNLMQGWLNLDVDPVPGAHAWDARQGIPLESQSVALVYSEHFIEHLEYGQAAHLLRECWRVLAPGGVLRLSTPDLAFLVQTYLNRQLSEWADVGWRPSTACDLLNEGLRLWGHQYVFDFESLSACLSAAGFQTLGRAPWRHSSIAALANLETRPFHNEIIIEAQKGW